MCVQEDKLNDTDTTIWIGQHVPIFASVSSNLIEKPVFLCNFNQRYLVEPFVDGLDRTDHSSDEIEVFGDYD